MNSTNNINVQVKSLMGFGAWKPHTIKVFVGCGAFFTAPFCNTNSTNNINVQVKSLMGLGAWKPSRRSSSAPEGVRVSPQFFVVNFLNI
jgi:hypothetical protein